MGAIVEGCHFSQSFQGILMSTVQDPSDLSYQPLSFATLVGAESEIQPKAWADSGLQLQPQQAFIS